MCNFLHESLIEAAFSGLEVGMKMIRISPTRRNFLRKAVAAALLTGGAIDVTSAVTIGKQEPYRPSYFAEEE